MALELEHWQAEIDSLRTRAQHLAELSSRRMWVESANGRVKSVGLLVHDLIRPDGTPYDVLAALAALHGVGQRVEKVRRKSMDEHVPADRQERVRRANEREQAFEEKARAVSEEMNAA